MSSDRIEQSVLLPLAEAADLAMRAAAEGVAITDFLGIQVLRGAYGAMHPLVIEFEMRPKVGQGGTEGEDSQ
ncbi:hypothetical protein [Burkholderia cenocepacia]|uniref:hypothetical protein n=1 Tax=Burkholderia cenocepacia TaxID=95486 RepID=UPI001B954505|nr:hypothetical protein [Burkholderia cenocepacia]MBR8097676.1 hypothetical protein [Burkholderia cenocepacia]MDI9683547.1 hypothetical protein [Burkholderia cenocepacia]HEP6427756.1 hypothetical protein [Burkholderia cenocepacia]